MIVEPAYEMICAYCVLPFLNAASKIEIEYEDTYGKMHSKRLEPGDDGLAKLMEIANEFPYTLTINREVIKDITPVSQVEGTLVCAVHVFTAVDRMYRRK